MHLGIDRKNALLLACIFVLVAVFGFWIPNLNVLQGTGDKNSHGLPEVKVTYGEHGFAPQVVTVPVGTTVAWSSPKGKPMWVASDPDPSHTKLKGFDEKGVINGFIKIFTGDHAYAHGTGVYEYTFTEVGTWKYHNHINPQHRGTVIVKNKE